MWLLRQSAETVSKAFPFVKALLRFSPHKTPSAYLIADSLLMLDVSLKGNLLKKVSAASIEDVCLPVACGQDLVCATCLSVLSLSLSVVGVC